MWKRFNIFYTFNRQRSGKYMYFLNFNNFYCGFPFSPIIYLQKFNKNFPKTGLSYLDIKREPPKRLPKWNISIIALSGCHPADYLPPSFISSVTSAEQPNRPMTLGRTIR